MHLEIKNIFLNRRAQRGFTVNDFLILLAVVFVIGIFVIPSYSDYTLRTRLAEGLVIASAARNVVVDNAVRGRPYDEGWMPIQVTRNTASIDIDGQTGMVTITGTKKVDNIVLLLMPMVNGVPLNDLDEIKERIEWVCSEPTGRVSSRDLPSECQLRTGA